MASSFRESFSDAGSDIKKLFFGDPDAIKKSYDDMMAKASGMTADTRNFLGQQQGKALAYFNPLQHMLQSAYGTEGIQGPQVPQGGMASLAGMYGRR